ncbi:MULTISPECIES: pyridoxal-phosphate-dependent aminotransferase family protein [Acetomicrobium]|uniref:Alanine--glyoxylate aminotransferase family protein n=1 Tax=Acetomicrobium hydrogeniformans TaxID=649746 RepID=A0A7V6ZEH3_9BACT|nr:MULTISPECIES: alanine--glyoxylate aminotransferase family protein [Acetomicrobium]HHZ04493.1 alanine--glyoxylate aminotransferase family protein [Acetomicrobium hydrogeniformans]
MLKPQKLVMIPGPTPVVRSIQDQMGRETVAFGDPDFIEDFKNVVKDLRELWQCSGQTFVIAGSGTLAMEMAVANVSKPGDKALVCSNGFFGDRFAEICKKRGLNVDVIKARWGSSVTSEEVKERLSKEKYDVVTVTHVETSTGVMAPIGEIGKVVQDHGAIFVVDGVAASGGAEEYVDSMGIDVLISCSQKAFGVAPGLALLWASKKALDKRKSLGTIIDSYMDFEKWLPVMEDPSKYWGTPPINLIWALKQSLEIIKSEGIKERYARHVRHAVLFDEAISSMGFSILADEGYRAPTLSVYLYPGEFNIDDSKFRSLVAEEGAYIAGCLGNYAGKGFRMGHMGNIDKHILISAVASIERAAMRIGIKLEPGKALGILQRGFVEESM